MSIVKFGSIVTSGSGSLGGSTIQPFRSTHVLRKKPLPPHSSTPAQRLIRSYNKTMQAGWRSLTDQARSLWNNYAKEKPVFNRSGEKHPLSGHSLWMKYQFDALSKGAPFMENPSFYPGPYFGPEIIINGGFDIKSPWKTKPGWVVSGGKANYDGLVDGRIYQDVIFPINTPFNLRFDISNCPATTALLFYDYTPRAGVFKPPYNNALFLPNGSYNYDVESFVDVTILSLIGYAGAAAFSVDNLSLRELIS